MVLLLLSSPWCFFLFFWCYLCSGTAWESITGNRPIPPSAHSRGISLLPIVNSYWSLQVQKWNSCLRSVRMMITAPESSWIVCVVTTFFFPWWVGCDVWQHKKRSRGRDVAIGSGSLWPDILFVLTLLAMFPAAVLCLSCWLAWRAPWVGHGQPVAYKCNTMALCYTVPQYKANGYFPGQTFKIGLDLLMLFSIMCDSTCINAKLQKFAKVAHDVFPFPMFYCSNAKSYWNNFAPGETCPVIILYMLFVVLCNCLVFVIAFFH